ncbi:PLP-dependent aminotransferase family protein [Mangrovicoccus sp. HB161399]|uniref:aminotransferase-like domain-containing protein n=1 Tax=Mangrovicoccus sp. HB161399 TaxID=2720392 RepID=UPI0015521782|nr:PLP-dependent aminotransferase family protein [Mangrovicoccus sp. HB161399]
MTDWTPRIAGSGKPRYLAIAEAIAADIRAGTLSPGDRLPPQRRLAERLGIDFTTVSRAYAEAQSRGLIDSHVGRGTFVAVPAPAALPTLPDEARAGETDLSMNMPPEPADPELLARMQAGLAYVGANLVPLLRYQSAVGSEKDRVAASTWLSLRGMVPRLERIAVTPGAHATMTAILTLLARPGDRVLCERITYPGLRNIAGRLGIELVGVPMDLDGMLPDALDAAIREKAPRAVYMNPTLQNPTTLTVPVERRLELSEAINRHGIPLIEDDAYGFIPPKAPAPLAVSAPELTWHIGGLAKCIGAGLRLAYTVAPSGRDAHALAQALRATSVMPSPINMALATQWIEDGTADSIRRFIRAESAARQQIAAEALDGHRYCSEENAFNIWLALPEGIGRADIVARMAGRPLGLMPADAFTVAGPVSDKLRVCLGGAISRDALREQLFFLANVMAPNAFMG